MRYIDLNPIISRPSVFKVALSQRGDGKTTELKRIGLENFYKTGKAGVFVRRFTTEIEGDFLETFWNNIETAHNEMLDGRAVKCGGSRQKGWWAAISGTGKDKSEWHKVFSIVALSMAGKKKSAFDFKTHKNVYFDEYIPLDGIYLPKEVTKIFALYKTIDREKSSLENLENYILLCGNKITRFNPVFQYFNVTQWGSGINTYRNGQLDILIRKNGANAREAGNTPLGILTKGTDYEEYNAGEFLISYDNLISRERSNILLLKVIHGGKVYGLFQGTRCAVFDVLTAKQAQKNVTCICVEAQGVRAGAHWLKYDTWAQNLLAKYKFTNTLLFANEFVLNELKKVYDAVK